MAEPIGAYLSVDGRRWRATDPAIPPGLKQELVNALMRARHEVKVAPNATSLRRARRHVQDAKVALGERGAPWWLPVSARHRDARIDATIRALLRARPGKTICPSDVARVIGGATWRAVLDQVRARAAVLAGRGQLLVQRQRRTVHEDLTTGVLRYRAPTVRRSREARASISESLGLVSRA